MSATASPPAAALPTMLLQTAASLENLLVDAYTTALGLPCLKDAAANAGLRAFLTAARGHHAAHANGFNAAVRRLGGAPQYAPDPRFAATVPRDLAALTDPASVASLLAALEDTAAQSYVRFTALAPAGGARGQFAAVAPVEAQHRAVLLIAHALPGARLAVRTAAKGGGSGS